MLSYAICSCRRCQCLSGSSGVYPPPFNTTAVPAAIALLIDASKTRIKFRQSLPSRRDILPVFRAICLHGGGIATFWVREPNHTKGNEFLVPAPARPPSASDPSWNPASLHDAGLKAVREKRIQEYDDAESLRRAQCAQDAARFVDELLQCAAATPDADYSAMHEALHFALRFLDRTAESIPPRRVRKVLAVLSDAIDDVPLKDVLPMPVVPGGVRVLWANPRAKSEGPLDALSPSVFNDGAGLLYRLAIDLTNQPEHQPN